MVNSSGFPQATPLQNPISIRHLSAFFTRSMWNKTQSFTSLLSRIVTNRSTALSSTAYVQILILRLGHPCQILLQSKHAGIPLNRIEFPKYKYEHIHLFIRLRVHIYMYVCMHACTYACICSRAHHPSPHGVGAPLAPVVMAVVVGGC